MKLHNLLDERLLLLRQPVSDKAEAVARLLDHMVRAYDFGRPPQHLSEAIAKREALGGTTFPSGLAVPHARLEGFEDVVIGVLSPESPFQDGPVKVSLVVMIFTAATKPSLYLNCLSAFTKMSKDPALLHALAGAAQAQSFISLVEAQNLLVRRPVLVEDVMSGPPISRPGHTSMKDILDLLQEHRHSYMPITDDAGHLLGEVRLLDLIEIGVPDYARHMTSLSFAPSLEAFEHLLEGESRFLAKDLMKKPAAVLSPEQPLLEAARLFLKTRERQLPVVRDGRLVGVLSHMDLLGKILRA